MNHRSLVAAFVAFGLCGCQLVPDRSAEDVARAVAAADWKGAEHVTLLFRDAGISPSVLRLKAGQPYRLTLLNAGVNHHYFNAPEFFAAIAAAKAEVPRYAEFKAVRFTAFEIFAAGGTLDLWFVPLDKGTYLAHCHLGDHREMGVEVMLVVE